jgi:uncharacterized protein (TIGR02145 family)
MAENLAYLPTVNRPADGWHYPEYYYVYDYNGIRVRDAKATDNYSIYGVLYNWSAAQEACPSGWHLPSDEEWDILTTFIGGGLLVGGKMKDTITGYWDNLNIGDTNESGFSGLPGGSCGHNGFEHIGHSGSWWTATEATEISAYEAWRRRLDFNSYFFRGNLVKGLGFSVRCVKDSVTIVVKSNGSSSVTGKTTQYP